jgi:beta-galactosidase GanA
MTAIKRVFMVDGKPFFPLGGQSSTSSAYNSNEIEPAFQAVKLLHGNTLLTDVYWEHIEPEEGKFDFSMVDDLLASARRHGLKLILLWFATWKK